MAWYRDVRAVLFIMFIVAVATILLTYAFSGNEIDIESVRHWAESAGIWAPLIFVLAYIILSIFIPTTPMMATAGILFGFKMGFVYTTISGFVSGAIIFLVARYLGGDFVEQALWSKFLPKIEKYHDKLMQHSILTTALLRITPVTPFNVLSIILGVSKIKTRDYLLGTFLGLIPSHLITVYFGTILFKLLSLFT